MSYYVTRQLLISITVSMFIVKTNFETSLHCGTVKLSKSLNPNQMKERTWIPVHLIPLLNAHLHLKYLGLKSFTVETLKGNEKHFESAGNSSYQTKFKGNFDQGKENLARVRAEFELSEFELSRFYCNTLSTVQTLHSWLKKFFSMFVLLLLYSETSRKLSFTGLHIGHYNSPSSLSFSFFCKIIILSYI